MLETPTRSQDKTRLAADLFAAWNAHDPNRVAEFYAPDYEGTDVSQAGPQRGRQGIRQAVESYLRAFPDLQIKVEQTIWQDDQIAVAWTARGTHQGPIMNIPPTGRAAMIQGVSMFTLAGGQIVRALNVWDVAGLLRSIGLLPELWPQP